MRALPCPARVATLGVQSFSLRRRVALGELWVSKVFAMRMGASRATPGGLWTFKARLLRRRPWSSLDVQSSQDLRAQVAGQSKARGAIVRYLRCLFLRAQ